MGAVFFPVRIFILHRNTGFGFLVCVSHAFMCKILMDDVYGRRIGSGSLQNIEVLKGSFIGPYIDMPYSPIC